MTLSFTFYSIPKFTPLSHFQLPKNRSITKPTITLHNHNPYPQQLKTPIDPMAVVANNTNAETTVTIVRTTRIDATLAVPPINKVRIEFPIFFPLKIY